jgi:high-affinity nickel-transport protein
MAAGALPQDWPGLLLVVFILGLKHGMDPDHLATIDGLTRFNALKRPRLSRWSGCLFSFGHGAVIMLVAGGVAVMATEWSAPAWLEHFGTWVSILFLLALGGANLQAVLRTPQHQLARTVALKGRLLGRLTETSHPVLIASVGAAFALSFDTLGQTALFSLSASRLSGWLFAVFLGLVFMLGMMVTDGANGLWVARLLRQADQRALIASRVLGLSIASLSLSLAALGIARTISPGIAALAEANGMALGLGVVAILAASFALGTRLARAA